MAVNLRNALSPSAEKPGLEGRLYLMEDELDRAVELMFLAVRRFYETADGPLSAHGLGDAHYRALAAIRRDEGLSVRALQAKLGVVKQSLARVLNELAAAGLITKGPGLRDRRERRLELTPEGREAERAVTAALRDRLSAIFRTAGSESVMGARRVLLMLADLPSADVKED